MSSWHARKNSRKQTCNPVLISDTYLNVWGKRSILVLYILISLMGAGIFFPPSRCIRPPLLTPSKGEDGISSLFCEAASALDPEKPKTPSVKPPLEPLLTLFGWGIALPRKPTIYHYSAHRENPFRYYMPPLVQQAVGERVSCKEQVLTAPQLTVTAACTVSFKKYLAVPNRAVTFAFRRRTCTTSNLLNKTNQIPEFRVWPEHQKADSPLSQNEVVGPVYVLPMDWSGASDPNNKTPTAQLLQSMKK